MATIDLGKIKQVWRGTYNSSYTYTADDLVEYTDNGVTSTYIAVATSSFSNQVPSTSGTATANYWEYVAKGVANPIPVQGGNSGKFLTTNGSAASWGTVTQVIKKIHTLTYATRTGGSSSANHDQFSWGSFTPLDVSNNFFISGQIPINSAGNDYCGFGLRFAGGSGNTDFSGDGSGYAASYNHMGIYTYHFDYTGTFNGAGTYTIYHRTFSSSSHPDAFCPNSSDDNRLVSQTSGTLQIIEYSN